MSLDPDENSLRAASERRTHAFNFQLVGFSLHRLGEAVERGIRAHTHRAARLNLQMADEASPEAVSEHCGGRGEGADRDGTMADPFVLRALLRREAVLKDRFVVCIH